MQEQCPTQHLYQDLDKYLFLQDCNITVTSVLPLACRQMSDTTSLSGFRQISVLTGLQHYSDKCPTFSMQEQCPTQHIYQDLDKYLFLQDCNITVTSVLPLACRQMSDTTSLSGFKQISVLTGLQHYSD